MGITIDASRWPALDPATVRPATKLPLKFWITLDGNLHGRHREGWHATEHFEIVSENHEAARAENSVQRFMREGNLRVVVGVQSLSVQLSRPELSYAQRVTLGTLFRVLGFLNVVWQIANTGSSGSLRDFYAALDQVAA